MKSVKNVNQTLNLIKGFACMGVICIHVVFPGVFGKIIACLSGFAVPIFFMISGYYSYNKDDFFACEKLPRKAIKILKIHIFSLLLYLLYYLVRNGLAILNNKYMYIDFVLYDRYDDINAIHLWFLPALIYCYLFDYMFCKIRLRKIWFVMIPLIFLLRVFSFVWVGGRFQYLLAIRNNGLFFYSIGLYIAQIKKNILKLKNLHIIIAAVIGIVMSIVSVFIKLNFVNLLAMGATLLSVPMFILAQKYPVNNYLKPIEYIGEKLSLVIYVVHLMVSDLLDAVLYKIVGGFPEIYYYFKPILVIIFCIVCALVVSKLQNYVLKQNRVNVREK